MGLPRGGAQDALKEVEIHAVPGEEEKRAVLTLVPGRMCPTARGMPMDIGLKEPAGGRRGGTPLHHADTSAEGGQLGWGQRIDIFAYLDHGLGQDGSDPERVTAQRTLEEKRTTGSASLLQQSPSRSCVCICYLSGSRGPQGPSLPSDFG